jgi:hypothetical protein
MASVRKGDVLALGTSTTALYFADAPDIARKNIRLFPFSPTAGGSQTSGSVSTVNILFSGNTNELKAQAGSTTYHSSSRRTAQLAAVLPATANDALATDLQAAINQLPQPASTGTGTTTPFTLGGQYSNINVSGFSDRIPAACQPTAATATIRNLNFVAYRDGTGATVRLQLASFEMACPNAGTSSGYVLIR